MGSEVFQQNRDGRLRLAVKLTPKAGRDGVQGVAADADGKLYLKVSVTAVPEDGKANKALIALLAKEWKLAKSAITLEQGATDRRKVLLIESSLEHIVSQGKFE